MQATVDRSLADCDAALFVLSAAEAIGAGDRFIAERLRASRLPVITVVNKVDRADPASLAATIATAAPLVDFRSLHPVSAKAGDGIGALRDDLPSILGPGPRYFPEGMATDQTDEELAAELIREAALLRLRQEVPHALAVDVEGIEPARRGVVVRAALLVETESQKGIVVGRGGGMVRDIGSAARSALGRLWGTEVHLDLTVRVRKRWRDDEAMLSRLGL
jgi:GTPase